jgi:hypothetical protein
LKIVRYPSNEHDKRQLEDKLENDDAVGNRYVDVIGEGVGQEA